LQLVLIIIIIIIIITISCNFNSASPGSAVNKPSYTHITKGFHTCLWYTVFK